LICLKLFTAASGHPAWGRVDEGFVQDKHIGCSITNVPSVCPAAALPRSTIRTAKCQSWQKAEEENRKPACPQNTRKTCQLISKIATYDRTDNGAPCGCDAYEDICQNKPNIGTNRAPCVAE
jgi:hypothetical protein